MRRALTPPLHCISLTLHEPHLPLSCRDAPGSLELGAKHLRAMENTVLPPAVDVDKGFTMAFVVLVCLFLLAVAMRYAKLVVDPCSAFSASTWEEE